MNPDNPEKASIPSRELWQVRRGRCQVARLSKVEADGIPISTSECRATWPPPACLGAPRLDPGAVSPKPQ